MSRSRAPYPKLLQLLDHPWVRHLRLPFNLLLSPIYLWGVLLANGSLRETGFWLGYLSLHLFLYGGTTAFNSYFDKDEGPIGGMLKPPEVDAGLLGFSLAVQLAGLPLALLAGPAFTLAWFILFAVFTAYSHPAVRLKANPWAALGAIALGQGAVGFAAGWVVGKPGLASLLEPAALLGMVTTALIITGLYIVTQSYQTGEDRARGDRTLPVMLGPRRALYVAVAVLAVGGAVMVLSVGGRFGWGWSAALGIFFAAVGTTLLRWAGRFDEREVTRNFYTAMRVAAVSSVVLSAVFLYHLI